MRKPTREQEIKAQYGDRILSACTGLYCPSCPQSNIARMVRRNGFKMEDMGKSFIIVEGAVKAGYGRRWYLVKGA